MDADDELCYWPVAALHRAYQARTLSPLETVRAYLERIERLDRDLRCYITVTADLAIAAARQAEARAARGALLGSLDGVPVGLKDLVDTAGVRTTAHSARHANRIPDTNAAVVEALLGAGAVLLGKQSLHEFAAGGPTRDGVFPAARNPWNVALVPGGSSSGSGAAVAAGLCAAALGTDTGGSVRYPASYCGVVGLKPTRGLVSRRGVIPLAWSLDDVGPITRTVEDAAILLQSIAEADPADDARGRDRCPDVRGRLRAGVRGLRLGAPLREVERAPDLHADTLAAYRDALRVFERLGAQVRSVDLPEARHVDTVARAIIASEALAYHQRDAGERPTLYGRGFYQALLEGTLISGTDYVNALRMRGLIGERMRELMDSVDLLALPTTPHPAWDFAVEARVPGWLRSSFTRLFNLTGQPAISVPGGRSTDGLPIGLQLAGRPFGDDVVLAAAHAYEAATGWSAHRPPLERRPPSTR
jgi:aspartyl-tRNA(Asn)/glutamyl-tRNA(Gln) amidotransferase subunit A